jgi:uncharacterized protein (DUF433 family)
LNAFNGPRDTNRVLLLRPREKEVSHLSEVGAQFSESIYGGLDPRDIPLYSLKVAARILAQSPATLRSWIAGRPYPTRDGEGWFDPLIRRPEPEDARLSFHNLIEANVLSALRKVHDIPMRKVRDAQERAEGQYGIDRLFISDQLLAAPGKLFLEVYGELVDLSNTQQLALKAILYDRLDRVVHVNGLASQYWPLSPTQKDRGRVIVVDPRISFGRPVIAKRGVTTSAIADRADAGEEPADIARDYELEEHEVEEAISFERLAA